MLEKALQNHVSPVTGARLDAMAHSLPPDDAAPGSFCVSPEGVTIACVCPCGCGAFFRLPVGLNEKPAAGPSWNWDGDRDLPTLSPSIRDLGGCCWHGHLQRGVWTPCDDSGRS